MFSKIFYCSTVWSNTNKSNVNELELVQNFAALIILGLRKFDLISQGIKSLKWLPVKDRLYLNDPVMMYKCIHKLVLDYLDSNFVQRSHLHISLPVRHSSQSPIHWTKIFCLPWNKTVELIKS